eukprot:TRINITY_DN9742_c0_g1_i6.p1 TRINITY_DN9742_c0_g1~~TRINITY_DN9742_c0_g1_i6.p1  ORF type:complete len:342 (-),score=79.34 TRINITY_DN9742_c0_g1_i6:359-1384(-)
MQAAIRRASATLPHGLRTIRRHLLAQDKNKNKMLERSELRAGMESAGVFLSDEEYEEIFARMDFNDDGSVHLDELLHAVRVDLSASRTLQVRQFFSLLDANQNNVVYLADLQAAYRPQHAPEVMEGQESEDQALETMIEAMDAKKKSTNGLVTFSEVLDYFTDAAQEFDENQWNNMMGSMWGLVGGDAGSCVQLQSSMHRSQQLRRADELPEYTPTTRLPQHLDPNPNAIAEVSFGSNIGDHNMNSPNRANCGHGAIYNRERVIPKAPEFGSYCVAELRPELCARFPGRGGLDPGKRSSETHDQFAGQSLAPRVAQSTFKSQDCLQHMTNEYLALHLETQS